ncbi:MAG: MoaD/ThiS family protein [Candidatus Bathyarchaeota archaeon]|nr:MAG: MoaD/ThiS family protein [Candidatus Bathyarchaeota archaeon]
MNLSFQECLLKSADCREQSTVNEAFTSERYYRFRGIKGAGQMIKITLRAYGHLGDLVNQRKRDFMIPACSLMEFIDFLSKTVNSSFKEKLVSTGTHRLAEYYRILVNGQDIGATQLDTQLHDGDEIIFFPPVGGG